MRSSAVATPCVALPDALPDVIEAKFVPLSDHRLALERRRQRRAARRQPSSDNLAADPGQEESPLTPKALEANVLVPPANECLAGTSAPSCESPPQPPSLSACAPQQVSEAAAAAAEAAAAPAVEKQATDAAPTDADAERRRRRRVRRQPSASDTPADEDSEELSVREGDAAPDLAAATAAAASGDVAALRRALGDVSLSDVPRPRPGEEPLLHTAARAGHAACVNLLVERGADLFVEARGGSALEAARQAEQTAVAALLENAQVQWHNSQAAGLLARQQEARALASEADAIAHPARHLAAAVLAARAVPSERRAEKLEMQRVALRDKACHLCCLQLAPVLAGVAPLGGCSTAHADHAFPSGVPAATASWLRSDRAMALLHELGELLPGRHAPPKGVSGGELALGVRVVQLRLREAASAALGRALGQDDCVPLLEALLVVACPAHAHSVLQRMQAQLSEAELLRQPDLASAVDGWALVLESVEFEAVAAFRRARREATFYSALSRTPPPNALLMAVHRQREPLPAVFDGFVQQLADDEAEAWERATSLEAHRAALDALVADMLPHGDQLLVAFNV